eukprot:UN15746
MSFSCSSNFSEDYVVSFVLFPVHQSFLWNAAVD